MQSMRVAHKAAPNAYILIKSLNAMNPKIVGRREYHTVISLTLMSKAFSNGGDS